MRVARSVLDKGLPLLVFPEGTRQSGDQIGELFDGTAWLASKTGAAIVPVGIAGTEVAMGSGTKGIKRTPVSVVVANVMDRPTGRVPRKQLTAITNELRSRLQSATDQAHKDLAERG